MLTAVATRVLWLGDRQLFRDEAASWLESSYSLGELLHVARTEPYPPLYAVALKGWMSLAGDGEAALRMFSVAAGIAMLLIAWRWAHEALGRWPAMLALLVLALSPVALGNARLARMYSMEAAFATACWWLTWRLISGRATGRAAMAGHAAALAVCTAGEVWTTALGLPTAVLQLAVAAGALALGAMRPAILTDSRPPNPALTDPSEPRRPAARLHAGAAWAAGAIALGSLTLTPWLPNLLAIAASGRAYWTPPPATFDWLVSWGTMLLGWREDVAAFRELRVLALLLAASGVGWLLTRRDISYRSLGWCVVGGLALTVAMWAVSLVRSIYDTRYLDASLPPLAIALAAGVGAIAHVLARVLRRFRDARSSAVGGAETASTMRFATFGSWLLVAAFLLQVLAPGTQEWLDEWRTEYGLGPSQELVAAIAPRVRSGDVILSLDARSFFTVAYDAEMRRARGEPLPAPVRNWDSGNEPFYRGQTLIRASETITPANVARGWKAALPELASDGSIWLVAIANGRNENLGFAPLDDGRMKELGRIFVQNGTGAAQARQLQVVGEG